MKKQNPPFQSLKLWHQFDLFVDRPWSTYFFQDPIPQPDDLGGPLLKAEAT